MAVSMVDRPGKLTLCPHCDRLTQTVERGACANCWQAKDDGGQPVIRDGRPRTSPLLGSLDNVPDVVWIALIVAVCVAIVRTLLWTLQ